MYHFELLNSAGGLVGTAYFQRDGWYFGPNVSGRKRSTKPHGTALDSVPSWAKRHFKKGGQWCRVDHEVAS